MRESVELAKELVEYTKLVGVRNKHIQQVAKELLNNVSGNVEKDSTLKMIKEDTVHGKD